MGEADCLLLVSLTGKQEPTHPNTQATNNQRGHTLTDSQPTSQRWTDGQRQAERNHTDTQTPRHSDIDRDREREGVGLRARGLSPNPYASKQEGEETENAGDQLPRLRG